MSENAQKISIAAQLHNFTRTKAADNFQNQAKKLPCHVTQVYNDDTVTVSFDVTQTVFTLPNTRYPQAFSKYSREPTQVGDPGYIVPNDVDLGGESGISGSTANMYQKGNLTTGVFHPISNTNFKRRDQNKFYQTGGPTGHIIQSQDEKSYHHIDEKGNINHIAAASMVHNATQGIMHAAGSSLLSLLLPGLPAAPGLPIPGGSVPILPTIPGIGATSLQGITHIAEQGIIHIADKALASIIPGQALSGITHIAEQAISHQSLASTITHLAELDIAHTSLSGAITHLAELNITHTSLNGAITHIAQQAITHYSLTGAATLASLASSVNIVPTAGLNIGAPSTTYEFSATDPPQPTNPTNVNIIGSLIASVDILAAGMISGGNMMSGGFPVMTQPIPPGLVNAPVTVTGARLNNPALASLLTGLASLGLITDQTTPE